MRQGQNALDVISRVKAKIEELGPGLPSGVEIVPVYDRSDLINKSIDTLKSTLIEVTFTVALVIVFFLWHLPSAIIPVITIPIAVLIAFIPFRAIGMTANIMSLGGIAIAIGALVDAAIVVVEQTHKRLEEWDRTGRRSDYKVCNNSGDQGSRRTQLLGTARHCGGVSSGAHARRPGRPSLQAACLYEEPVHDRCGDSHDHTRPGTPAAVHACAELQFPACVAEQGCEPGAGGQDSPRRPAPGLEAPNPVV